MSWGFVKKYVLFAMTDIHKASVLISVRVLCLLTPSVSLRISPIVSGRCCLLGHPPPLPPRLPRSYLGLCAFKSYSLHMVQLWLSAHDHWLQKEAACPISVEGVCRLTSLLDPRNSRPRGRHGDMSYSIFFRFLTFILHFWWLRRKPSWRFLYTIGVDACLVFLAWMACLFSLRASCSHRQGNGPTRWYPTGLSEVPVSRLLVGFNFVSLLNFSQWSRCIELFNLHLFYSNTKHFFSYIHRLTFNFL